MSDLLVDIGNTRAKWAVLRGGRLSPARAVVHGGKSSAMRAIVRAATEATGVANIPAARDLKK